MPDHNRPLISVTIITLNEEHNLPRCLQALKWADEIVVIDTNSNDRTVEIAKSHGATVINEPWHGYGAQKNIAMSHAKGPWVLNVDADEVITPALREEIIAKISSTPHAQGYAIARKTYYMGRWIRFGGWYPNYVTRLCRKDSGRWTEPEVHEELRIQGACEKLSQPMEHYTFRTIGDQVRTNVRYAQQGAQELAKNGVRFSLFRLLFKPLFKFLETYFAKFGFLDGVPGLVISINAAHSMFMKQAFLLEGKSKSDT